MKKSLNSIITNLFYKITDKVLILPQTIKRLIALSFDFGLCLFTSYLAFYLRLGEFVFHEAFIKTSLLSVILSLPIFLATGQYRAIFRYSSWATFKDSTWSIVLYSCLFYISLKFLYFREIPSTIGIIQPLLFFMGIVGSRLFLCFWLSGDVVKHFQKKPSQNAVIYGAGAAGRQVAEILSNGNKMKVVGFIDDDKALYGRTLNLHKIFGPDDLPSLIHMKQVTHILLAIPTISSKRRNDILHNISKYKIIVRTLPSLGEIVGGRVAFSNIHDLNIDDLLTRDVVEPNCTLLAKNIYQKVVLITGAGGSIGSELCRQVIHQRPRILLLLEISEYSLYSIHEDLNDLLFDRNENSNIQLIPILSSIQDKKQMLKIFDVWKPNTVYHSAAYKHVPLVENNLIEGIKNNVFGTLNIAKIAIKKNVSDFVMISTDKAVRPTNVMGASKRLAEMCLQALFKEQQDHKKSKTLTKLSMVRFGNVLDSSGSVIPRFRKQILKGESITLTHPDITRYFMTIKEAAQLVIQAGAMGRGGDVFVLDMGEPVRIIDLAKQVIKLSGLSLRDKLNPDGDIEIIVTGLRPGEKLYEELLLGQNPKTTKHSKIQKTKEPFVPWTLFEKELMKLNESLNLNNVGNIILIIKNLVDGYKPSDDIKAIIKEQTKER